MSHNVVCLITHRSIQCSYARIRLTSFARSMTCLSLHPIKWLINRLKKYKIKGNTERIIEMRHELVKEPHLFQEEPFQGWKDNLWGFLSCTTKISSTPNTFIKILKVTLLTSSSSFFFFIHNLLFSSYNIHFCGSWLSSSFVVVFGLVEMYCYVGSLLRWLVLRCNGGGMFFFFLQLRWSVVYINKHTD